MHNTIMAMAVIFMFGGVSLFEIVGDVRRYKESNIKFCDFVWH